MLDKFKSMSALAGLMANGDKVRDAAEKIRVQMEGTRVEGTAGNGACRAVVTGSMRVISVEMSPALLTGMSADERTRELAAGLIAEAVNAGLAEARARLKIALDEHARALGLPGGFPDLGLPGV